MSSELIQKARGEAKPFLFVLAVVAALGGLLLVGALGGAGTFVLYAAVGLIALAFFAVRVPETNGRSLEEIEQQLQRKVGDKTRSRDEARPANVGA